jgi:ferredoxin-NADP reductase
MTLTLVESKDEFPGVHTFVFEPEEPITWQPGQYMHYVFDHPSADSRGNERWFTIASPPFEKDIHITTRITSDKGSSFKQALLDLKPGDTVEADGPEGDFVLKEGDFHHILTAGGIGITPYYAMLSQLAHDNEPANVDLLYANSDDKFIFDDELTAWAIKDPTLKIHKFVDKRITEEDLKPFVGDPKNLFYISGPEPMVESYEELLPKLGVDKDKVVTDFFPGY